MTGTFAAAAIAVAVALTACSGGSSEPTTTQPLGPGDIASGSAVYQSTCSACHGDDAQGIDGLGKPLVDSDFITTQTESELAAFIDEGRPKGDPDNMTGRDMPPSGGNPSLSDQELRDVAAYLISLN